MYCSRRCCSSALAAIEALLMRIQLAVPNNHFLAPDTFNQVFTMHGTTMIFLVVMPMLIGLAIYLVPLMIGARDMAFPRLNAMSFWLQVFGGLLLYFSFSPAARRTPDGSATRRSASGRFIDRRVDYWALALPADRDRHRSRPPSTSS